VASGSLLRTTAASAAVSVKQRIPEARGNGRSVPAKPLGVSVEDVDWDSQDGRYRVRVQGQWIVVPDAALVTEPNRFGPAVVWPFLDGNGVMQIRCFLPGANT
jgi:hypothetical protein